MTRTRFLWVRFWETHRTTGRSPEAEIGAELRLQDGGGVVVDAHSERRHIDPAGI